MILGRTKEALKNVFLICYILLKKTHMKIFSSQNGVLRIYSFRTPMRYQLHYPDTFLAS